MWLFTPIGFFSAVLDPNSKAGRLQIRARVRVDLDNLRSLHLPELSKTVELQNRDYPYRAYCTKEEWAGALVSLALAVDYSNFKSAVTKTQGNQRHDLYMQVWSAMNDAERKLKEPPKWSWGMGSTSTGVGFGKSKKKGKGKQLSLGTGVGPYSGARTDTKGADLYPQDGVDPFDDGLPPGVSVPDGYFDEDDFFFANENAPPPEFDVKALEAELAAKVTTALGRAPSTVPAGPVVRRKTDKGKGAKE
jgi:hypothetical protein